MDGGTLTQGFVRRGGLHPWAILVFFLPGEGMDPGGRWLASAVSHPCRKVGVKDGAPGEQIKFGALAPQSVWYAALFHPVPA